MPSPRDLSRHPLDGKLAWQWRYEEEFPPEPTLSTAEDERREEALDRSWFRLQIWHTPFRAVDRSEYLAHTGWLKKLEEFFMLHPELEPYYRECFAEESHSPLLDPVPYTVSESVAALIDHVAANQAHFMEEVFFGLQLGRYGNASDNRGWMNLFRRWGRSHRFNKRLDQLRSILTLSFLEFYDLYLCYYDCRIDEHPIPHPWDPKNRRKRDRDNPLPPARSGGEPGPCGDPATTGPAEEPPPKLDRDVLPGLFLDSGVREAHRGEPLGARPLPQPGEGLQGVEDTKGGSLPYETPGPAAGEPSGESGPPAANE